MRMTCDEDDAHNNDEDDAHNNDEDDAHKAHIITFAFFAKIIFFYL